MYNFCRNISYIGKGRNNEQIGDPIGGLHDPDPPGKFLQETTLAVLHTLPLLLFGAK